MRQLNSKLFNNFFCIIAVENYKTINRKAVMDR